jgi:hypothetical protein
MRALLLVVAAAVVSSLAARPLRAQEDAQEEDRDDAVESAVAHLLDADVPRGQEPEAIAAAVTLGPKVGTRLLERFFEVTVAEAGERWHREDTATRERRVLAVLRGLARGAEPAVARLIAETKDPPPETRDVVWRWILELGPWVPYLAEELRALAPPEHAQREWDIWDWASWERFQAGLRIGPDAPLEELITVLEDGECLAIEFAAEVLKERGPSAAAALEPLAAVLARAGEVAVLHQGGSSLYRVPSFRYLLEDALAAIAPADARALPGCGASSIATTRSRNASPRRARSAGWRRWARRRCPRSRTCAGPKRIRAFCARRSRRSARSGPRPRRCPRASRR